jgi:hypothetical protein
MLSALVVCFSLSHSSSARFGLSIIGVKTNIQASVTGASFDEEATVLIREVQPKLIEQWEANFETANL